MWLHPWWMDIRRAILLATSPSDLYESLSNFYRKHSTTWVIKETDTLGVRDFIEQGKG